MKRLLIAFLTLSFGMAQTVIDDFETNVGEWEDPNYSGSTAGVLTTSSFTVSTDFARNGTQSGKLVLLDDGAVAGGWFVRMTNRNDQIAPNSKLGLWLRAHNPQVQIRFVIWDNGAGGSGYEAGPWLIATAEVGDWQWFEVDLATATFTGWVNGDGAITSTDYVTIESLQLQTTADINDTLYIDDVTEITAGTMANVTFQVNMATFPGGATDSTSTMHIRGGMNGWSDIDMMSNLGGDYWTISLPLTVGSTVEYKFTHTDALGSLTWESIANRSLTVPAADDTLLVYFDDLAAYTPTADIDVWFRLNMAGVVDFDAAASSVGVRGGTTPLDWGADLALSREGTTLFYSGQASFANANAGTTVEYKFVYDPGTGVVWEGVANRTFIAGPDTTLAWKWFNDTPAAADIDTFQVTFVLNTALLDNFTDSTATGFVTGSYDNWDHWNDTLATSGDYHSRTIEVIGDAAGVDFVYKFVYKNSIGEEIWESVADRPITVDSDVTVFHYWNDAAPFTPTADIDVWFRVNMSGVAGFDQSSATVGVRGSEPPLDWGADQALAQEGTSYYYSGLVSFPTDSAGQMVYYKFVYDQGGINWEGNISDRTFSLSQDTTLAFKYFDDAPPTGQEAVTAYVYFTADMAAYEDMGLFSVVRNDSMQVRGGFNGWAASAEPDGSDLKMTRITGTTIYELNAPVTKFPNTLDYYKYYIQLSQESLTLMESINPYFYADMGYENPPRQGAGNRSFTFIGDPNNPQLVGLEFYNGLPFEGIVPDGHVITVTHSVDMSQIALDGLFSPVEDTLWLIFQDPWAEQLNGYSISEDSHHPDLILNDSGQDGDAAAGDSIYTVTFDLTGKTPYYMMYVYEFLGPNNTLQEGGGYDYGRYRIRYIHPTISGTTYTWPTAWTFPQDVWTTDPPLVVESPPAGVGTGSDVQLPQEFLVYQNYPNPFNPVTEIKFVLPEAGQVRFTIYNLLGQQVLSYKNTFTAPGTYGLRWNGTDTQGRAVSSGIYFYEIRTDKQRMIKKMTLLK